MLIQQSETAVLGMISVPINLLFMSQQYDCILENIFSVYAIYIQEPGEQEEESIQI